LRLSLSVSLSPHRVQSNEMTQYRRHIKLILGSLTGLFLFTPSSFQLSSNGLVPFELILKGKILGNTFSHLGF
jgi:hypothetical protein